MANDLYVMRRANGDLFTEEIGGRISVPLLSTRDLVDRYKARNPELAVFFPAPLDSRMKKKMKALGLEQSAEFFLLSDDDPDAYLDKGRPIRREEIFAEVEAPATSVASQS